MKLVLRLPGGLGVSQTRAPEPAASTREAISDTNPRRPSAAARTVAGHVLGRRVQLERSLKVSADKVCIERPPAEPEQVKLLLALYGETCTSWRALVDVRFKLLGLVPAVSAVALATLLSRGAPGEGLEAAVGAGIAVFGLAITLALFTYDERNSQLHDELISRGRRIEYELGIEVGQFLGRPGSWSFVKHDTATQLVYLTTLLAWVVAAIVFVLRGG